MIRSRPPRRPRAPRPGPARVLPLILNVALLLLPALLAGCGEEPPSRPAAPDKAYLGGEADADALVDTRILAGEADDQIPGDPQVYPYYVVRHGPQAGVHAFAAGDTVPDRAYVVLKARASTGEPGPQQFSVQGLFRAGGYIRGGDLWFSFQTTYSAADLRPTWLAPPDGLAADTLGFAAGPFRYDVAMRALLRLGADEVYRDPTPDTLRFFGNFPPCLQRIELRNPLHQATGLAAAAACWEDPSLASEAHLVLHLPGAPAYDPAAIPEQPYALPGIGELWLDPDGERVRLQAPPDPENWLSVAARTFRTVIYLHGRDHLQELPPPGRLIERVRAWRYQIDHAADPGNVLREGPGADDLDLLFGFDLAQNEVDPLGSDRFITDTGVWGLRYEVAAPLILQFFGPEAFWEHLLEHVAAPPRPEDPAQWPAWQQDPAVQRAAACWRLATLVFGEGSLSVVAVDQAPCAWNPQSGRYHYYAGTRIPGGHGRACEDGAYDDPDGGITELDAIDLDDFAAESDGGQPLVKPLRITLELADGTSFAGGPPPGWRDGRSGRSGRNGSDPGLARSAARR